MAESSVFDRLLNIGEKFAVPAAEKYIIGDDGKTEKAKADSYLAGILAANKVNGSGPTNGQLAASQSPTGVFDFLFGKTKAPGGKVMYSPWPLFLIAGLVGGVVWLAKR